MIETHDLSKEFNGFWAVDGVTVTVGPGQILALLGQNGAGKTTTVRMLTALLRPSRGMARVAGYSVRDQPKNVRASVGVLTEQHGLYVRMTAGEYLEFFGRLHQLPENALRPRIADLLRYFGLADAASHRIGEYSKGMRQKLALARALIHEPPVLLLDEPTSAMDPESARLVRDEIARLRTAKRTIVICTHNLSEAEALADIVAVIYRGRILLAGTLADIKRAVLGSAEFQARLSEPWNPEGLRLPTGVRLVGRGYSALDFRVDDPPVSNPDLMRQLVAMRAPLVAFEEVPRTLEQVYLEVMARVHEPEATVSHE
jgi:ABC-2 type transport system ATP-binding protein